MFRALQSSLLAVLLAGCASTPKTAPALVSGQELTLRFDWPEGVTAHLRTEERKERQGQVMEQTEGSETLRWERKEGELFVTTQVNKRQGGDSEMVALLEKMTPPTEVLDLTTGKLLRLEGLEPAVEALQQALEEAENAPADKEKMGELLRESLVSTYESTWDTLVTFWANRPVTLGQSIRGDTVGATGIPGTEDVKQNYEYRVERAIPCNAKTVEQRCVLLSYRSTPDPELLPQIANQMMQATLEASGRSIQDAPPITRFELATTLELITEPLTLLPHRLVKKRTLVIGFEVPGRGKMEMTQVDTETSRYTYQPAR